MSSVSPADFFALLTAAVLVTTIVAGGAAQATATNGEAFSDRESLSLQPAEQSNPAESDWEIAANSSLSAELQSSGDAEWTLSVYFDLSSENETEAYQALQADFLDDDTETTEFVEADQPGLGIESFVQAVESVNAHTDREMEITDIERTTASSDQVAAGTGRLSVEFVWTNFARAENNRLIIDDVLVTETGQLWLPGLYESQHLTISAPSEFGVFDSGDGVSPEQGELRWTGPVEFTEGSLQATFIGNDNSSVTSGSNIGFLFWLAPFAVLVLILAVIAGRTKELNLELPSSPGQDELRETDTEQTQPSPGQQTESSEESEELDVELLSDEERVERLLSENGGRMKQANIVKETDWSNAKVSQLLSSMEEEGRINKLRIGRENLISFPDDDITDIEE